METTRLLATAMAERCRAAIEAAGEEQHLELPDALRASHLRWMCLQIESHVEHWHLVRIHRWIGFIQAGMLANGMLSLSEAKTMFDEAKVAYGKDSDDLVDHLNLGKVFSLEIGGEG